MQMQITGNRKTGKTAWLQQAAEAMPKGQHKNCRCACKCGAILRSRLSQISGYCADCFISGRCM